MVKLNGADVIVVGSGFFGLTIAERISSELGKSVLVLEKRNHIGGNAYSYIDDATGVEVHKYGSHLFHTNNEKVWKYVNKFSHFNNYQHRVLAIAHGQYLNLPINLQTISNVFGKIFTPQEAKKFFEGLSREVIEENLEARALNLVGKELYEILIKGYTEKQWGTSTTDLPASIINRLPVRNNLDSRYFTDLYQGLPIEGYSDLFGKMIDSKNITVELNIDFFSVKEFIESDQLVVYTGPLDRFFNYKHGVLGWRTVDFEFQTIPLDDFQGNAVINYCDREVPYTRIHEFFHLHPERTKKFGKTIIAKEYSRVALEGDEPYYPINSKSDRDKLLKYREEKIPENYFLGGRLGTYKYLDMHMAIASALSLYETKISRWFED